MKRLRKRLRREPNDRSQQLDSEDLGYVVDPLYGKLCILRVGEAGNSERAFLVKGENFGPEWREEPELISVHLNQVPRKKS